MSHADNTHQETGQLKQNNLDIDTHKVDESGDNGVKNIEADKIVSSENLMIKNCDKHAESNDEEIPIEFFKSNSDELCVNEHHVHGYTDAECTSNETELKGKFIDKIDDGGIQLIDENNIQNEVGTDETEEHENENSEHVIMSASGERIHLVESLLGISDESHNDSCEDTSFKKLLHRPSAKKMKIDRIISEASSCVTATQLGILRLEITDLLSEETNQECLLSSFCEIYRKRFNKTLDPKEFGLQKPCQVLYLIPDICKIIQKHKAKWVVAVIKLPGPNLPESKRIKKKVKKNISIPDELKVVEEQVSEILKLENATDNFMDLSKFFSKYSSKFGVIKPEIFDQKKPVQVLQLLNSCEINSCSPNGQAQIKLKNIVQTNKNIITKKTSKKQHGCSGEHTSKPSSSIGAYDKMKKMFGNNSSQSSNNVISEMCKHGQDKISPKPSIYKGNKSDSCEVSDQNVSLDLNVFRQRMKKLLRDIPKDGCTVHNLLETYKHNYGSDIDPNIFGFDEVDHLFKSIPDLCGVSTLDGKMWIKANNKGNLKSPHDKFSKSEHIDQGHSVSKDSVKPSLHTSGIRISSKKMEAHSKDKTAMLNCMREIILNLPEEGQRGSIVLFQFRNKYGKVFNIKQFGLSKQSKVFSLFTDICTVKHVTEGLSDKWVVPILHDRDHSHQQTPLENSLTTSKSSLNASSIENVSLSSTKSNDNPANSTSNTKNSTGNTIRDSSNEYHKLEMLQKRMETVLRQFPLKDGCMLPQFFQTYTRIYGEKLDPAKYKVLKCIDLINIFPSVFKITETGGKLWLKLKSKETCKEAVKSKSRTKLGNTKSSGYLKKLQERISSLLEDVPKVGISASTLLSMYMKRYDEKVDPYKYNVNKPTQIFSLFPDLCHVDKTISDKWVIPIAKTNKPVIHGSSPGKSKKTKQSRTQLTKLNSTLTKLDETVMKKSEFNSPANGKDQDIIQKLMISQFHRQSLPILSKLDNDGCSVKEFLIQHRIDYGKFVSPKKFGVGKPHQIVEKIPDICSVVDKTVDGTSVKWVIPHIDLDGPTIDKPNNMIDHNSMTLTKDKINDESHVSASHSKVQSLLQTLPEGGSSASSLLALFKKDVGTKVKPEEFGVEKPTQIFSIFPNLCRVENCRSDKWVYPAKYHKNRSIEENPKSDPVELQLRIWAVLDKFPETEGCPLSKFFQIYEQEFRETLKPDVYGVSKPSEVLTLVPDVCRIVTRNKNKWVMFSENHLERELDSDSDSMGIPSHEIDSDSISMEELNEELQEQLLLTGPNGNWAELSDKYLDETLSSDSESACESSDSSISTGSDDSIVSSISLKELEERVVIIVDTFAEDKGCKLSKFFQVYSDLYDDVICPDDFHVKKPSEVLNLLSDTCKIVERNDEKWIVACKGNSRRPSIPKTSMSHAKQCQLKEDLTLVLSHFPVETGCRLMHFYIAYEEVIGTKMVPAMYGVRTVSDILRLLPNTSWQIVIKNDEKWVIFSDSESREHLLAASDGSSSLDRLSDRIISVLSDYPASKGCKLSQFFQSYRTCFGESLMPQLYGVNKPMEVLLLVSNICQVLKKNHDMWVMFAEPFLSQKVSNENSKGKGAINPSIDLKILRTRVLAILSKFDVHEGCMLSKFGSQYKLTYNERLNPKNYGVETLSDALHLITDTCIIKKKDGVSWVVLSEDMLELQIRFTSILASYPRTEGCSVNKFFQDYCNTFGTSVNPAKYGVSRPLQVLYLIPHVCQIVETDGNQLVKFASLDQMECIDNEDSYCSTVDDLNILRCRVLSILNKYPLDEGCQLATFFIAYKNDYGRLLSQSYGKKRPIKVLKLIPDSCQIIDKRVNGNKQIKLPSSVIELNSRVSSILEGCPGKSSQVSRFFQLYYEKYGKHSLDNINAICKEKKSEVFKCLPALCETFFKDQWQWVRLTKK